MGRGEDQVDAGHQAPGHSHTAGINARNLAMALAITGAFLLAATASKAWFDGLVLFSRGAYMFAVAAALGIAPFAIRAGQRPAHARRTYGYRRVELVASPIRNCEPTARPQRMSRLALS